MSLRERKKQRTKEQIQDAGFRLVREQGFDATTIEAIAAAADVSPSTVYRYFGTKEGVLLWDELEPPSWDVLDQQLEVRPPLEAVLATFEAVLDLGFHVPEAEIRSRIRLVFELPQLRSAFRDALDTYERELTAIIANHTPEGRLEARVIAAVAIGTLGAVLEDWALAEDERPLATVAESALGALYRALPSV